MMVAVAAVAGKERDEDEKAANAAAAMTFHTNTA